MTDPDFDTQALLKCTECGRRFTTPSDGTTIKHDGVQEHGGEFHEDERWDYIIEDRDIHT